MYSIVQKKSWENNWIVYGFFCPEWPRPGSGESSARRHNQKRSKLSKLRLLLYCLSYCLLVHLFLRRCPRRQGGECVALEVGFVYNRAKLTWA